MSSESHVKQNFRDSDHKIAKTSFFNNMFTTDDHGQHYSRRSYFNSSEIIFNKEMFVKSNFRFILKKDVDQKKYLQQMDAPIFWDDVLFVECTIPQDTCCPICLDTPKIPRVGRCGHIYCDVCIKACFAHSKGHSSKCSICGEVITENMLRPVYLKYELKPLQPHDSVSFLLVQHTLSVLCPIPIHSHLETVLASYHIPNASDYDARFCKIILEDEDYNEMIDIQNQLDFYSQKDSMIALGETMYMPYLQEIEKEICKFEDLNKVINMRKSRKALQINKEKQEARRNQNQTIIDYEYAKESETKTNTMNSININPVLAESVSGQVKDSSCDAWNSEDDDDELKSDTKTTLSNSYIDPIDTVENSLLNAMKNDLKKSEPKICNSFIGSDNQKNYSLSSKNGNTINNTNGLDNNNNNNNNNMKTVYFYQESKGRRCLLHPYIMKGLLMEYHAYESMPFHIRSRVIDTDAIFTTKEARNKYIPLKIFPLFCEVYYIEIDTNKLFSHDVLKQLKPDIEQRENQRRRKFFLSKRLDKQKHNEEDQLYIPQVTPIKSTEIKDPKSLHDYVNEWPSLSVYDTVSNNKENNSNNSISVNNTDKTQKSQENINELKSITPEEQYEIDKELALSLSDGIDNIYSINNQELDSKQWSFRNIVKDGYFPELNSTTNQNKSSKKSLSKNKQTSTTSVDKSHKTVWGTPVVQQSININTSINDEKSNETKDISLFGVSISNIKTVKSKNKKNKKRLES